MCLNSWTIVGLVWVSRPAVLLLSSHNCTKGSIYWRVKTVPSSNATQPPHHIIIWGRSQLFKAQKVTCSLSLFLIPEIPPTHIPALFPKIATMSFTLLLRSSRRALQVLIPILFSCFDVSFAFWFRDQVWDLPQALSMKLLLTISVLFRFWLLRFHFLSEFCPFLVADFVLLRCLGDCSNCADFICS